MTTYASPTWVDVPPDTPVPVGAPALNAANLQALTDAVAALASGGVSGFKPVGPKTANYTAAAGEFVLWDTTSASLVMTLPTAPPDQTTVGAKIVVLGAGHTVTINCGGSDVFNKTGGGTSLVLSLVDQAYQLEYIHATHVWLVTGIDLSVASLNAMFVPFPVLTSSARVFVSLAGSDSNNGLTEGTPKLTPAAAATALRAVGGGIMDLGYGSFTLTATLNLTDLPGIQIRGKGSRYTSLVLNTGSGSVGIDCTGTERWKISGVQLYTIGQSTPATTAILQARSATNTTAQFAHLEDVWINMHTDMTANGGAGTIGVYNNAGEIAAVGPEIILSSDRPYVATAGNCYSIASTLVTHNTGASMGVVDISGAPTLIALGAAAITLDSAVGFRFRGYINRSGGTNPYAIEVLTACTDIEIHALIEGFTQALKTVANITKLDISGTIKPNVSDILVLCDGSTGGNPGILGGSLDLVPGNTNAHSVLGNPSGTGQLGCYSMKIRLYANQTLGFTSQTGNLEIVSDSAAPTLAANINLRQGTQIRAKGGYHSIGGPIMVKGITAPTLAAGANNGGSPPAPNSTYRDNNHGDINFGSGTSPAAGAQVTVTFTIALDNPKIVVMPGNAATQALGLYVSAVSTAGFTISSVNAPAASQSNGTYFAHFICLG